MLIWPAIDLLGGACVRLRRGSYREVTEWSRDPVGTARAFAVEGAAALHVVDLDGAREGTPRHRDLILEIRRRCPLPLQVGGGVRTAEDAALYLAAGVERVILGTAAGRSPALLEALVARHGPERIVAAVDVAEDGRPRVEGWREAAGVSPEEHLEALRRAGVTEVLFTAIARDGTLAGPDLEGARRVIGEGFRTVVAGGIAGPGDVRALRRAGAAGAVVGSALYRGSMTLAEVLAAARGGAGAAGPGGAPPRRGASAARNATGGGEGAR